MMTMKKHYFLKYITLVLLMISIYSCKKDFVDLTPQGLIPVDNYFIDEQSVKSALNGTYSSLRIIYNNNWTYSELPSDNTVTFNETEANYGEMDKFTWTATSPRIQE